jgi:glutathione reductase (NADPH)
MEPDKSGKYDLIVIGTGSAATTIATRCRSAGWKVAIVDSRPFGGTCELRGCDPKKVLVGAAELVDWNRRMLPHGIDGRASIHWPALMQFKRSFTEPVPKSRENSFIEAGIDPFHGRARFTAPSVVEVAGRTLEAKKVAIAAGAKPANLKIPGAEHAIGNDRFLELDHLPRRIGFVGGGYISFEFAHIAARAGAEATIVHRGARPLPGFDPDLVDLLVQHTRRLSIDVQLETVLTGIEKNPGGYVMRARTRQQDRALEADLVAHGAGRAPNIEDMGLREAGVEFGPKGVRVNEHMQSFSNPAVYAAGDCADGGPHLTPVAVYQGEIAAANLLEGNHRKADYTGIPSVVFTTPPLASVGLQERAARDQGLRFRVNYGNTAGWYSSRRIAEECSGFKVLIEEGSGRVLGAHLLGHGMEEVINAFALAIRLGLTAAQLKSMIYTYPTNSSNIVYML